MLEICSSAEECFNKEIYYIQQFNAVKSSTYYNQASGGAGGYSNYASKTYEESHKEDSCYRNYYWSKKHQRGLWTERDEMWLDLGYNVEYYDFESDGLRFSTSINFS